jgi:DNA-binding NarL/FixJ family response regulator
VIVVPAPSTNGTVEQSARHPIEALVIDRQPLFLAALANLLAVPPLAAHVQTASRSDVGLDIARTAGIDILFCELHAEPLSGVEVVRTLAEEDHAIPVVLLGDEGEESQLAASLALSVAGAFSKNTALDEFLEGVRAVVSGHRAIGSGVLVRLLEGPSAIHTAESPRVPGRLSPTELAILAMIGQAQSIAVIAETRGISHKTVRNHLAKIYRKLELHGRTEAMLWAARMGLTGN